MGLFYHRKKDTVDKNNTADPWNTYGVDYGKSSKKDSQKETFIHKAATEDLPAKPKEEDSEEDKSED